MAKSHQSEQNELDRLEQEEAKSGQAELLQNCYEGISFGLSTLTSVDGSFFSDVNYTFRFNLSIVPSNVGLNNTAHQVNRLQLRPRRVWFQMVLCDAEKAG